MMLSFVGIKLLRVLLFLHVTVATLTVDQYENLNYIYNNYNGSGWVYATNDTWDFSTNETEPCHWEGVECSGTDIVNSSYVVRLRLSAHNLRGNSTVTNP